MCIRYHNNLRANSLQLSSSLAAEIREYLKFLTLIALRVFYIYFIDLSNHTVLLIFSGSRHRQPSNNTYYLFINYFTNVRVFVPS